MLKITAQPIAADLIFDKIERKFSGSVVMHCELLRKDLVEKGAAFVEYEQKGNASEELEDISLEIKKKWRVEDVVLIRRIGKVTANDTILVAAVSATYSEDAFEACQYAVEQLKQMKCIKEKEKLQEVKMFKNILLATKFSPKAEIARDVAIRMVKAVGANLYILTVFNYDFLERVHADGTAVPEEAKNKLREHIENRLDNYIIPFKEQSINPAKIIKVGDAETRILETAKEIKADLIIIGASTRKGILLDRFLQNITDKVRKHASCHVLTIT